VRSGAVSTPLLPEVCHLKLFIASEPLSDWEIIFNCGESQSLWQKWKDFHVYLQCATVMSEQKTNIKFCQFFFSVAGEKIQVQVFNLKKPHWLSFSDDLQCESNPVLAITKCFSIEAKTWKVQITSGQHMFVQAYLSLRYSCQ
jgi:hypothetical protein